MFSSMFTVLSKVSAHAIATILSFLICQSFSLVYPLFACLNKRHPHSPDDLPNQPRISTVYLFILLVKMPKFISKYTHEYRVQKERWISSLKKWGTTQVLKKKKMIHTSIEKEYCQRGIKTKKFPCVSPFSSSPQKVSSMELCRMFNSPSC